MGHKFKPTVNQRAQVMRCVADNMRHEQIARRLGIDEETLSNEFSRELKLGLRIMRQMLLAMATRTAIKGVNGRSRYSFGCWSRGQPAGGECRGRSIEPAPAGLAHAAPKPIR
jgi:DNA-binding CsgD family transcriptional regulator